MHRRRQRRNQPMHAGVHFAQNFVRFVQYIALSANAWLVAWHHAKAGSE
jgi:hypothetical protein